MPIHGTTAVPQEDSTPQPCRLPPPRGVAFVLPGFAGEAYLGAWWVTTGLYVLIAGAIIWRTRVSTG